MGFCSEEQPRIPTFKREATNGGQIIGYKIWMTWDNSSKDFDQYLVQNRNTPRCISFQEKIVQEFITQKLEEGLKEHPEWGDQVTKCRHIMDSCTMPEHDDIAFAASLFQLHLMITYDSAVAVQTVGSNSWPQVGCINSLVTSCFEMIFPLLCRKTQIETNRFMYVGPYPCRSFFQMRPRWMVLEMKFLTFVSFGLSIQQFPKQRIRWRRLWI